MAFTSKNKLAIAYKKLVGKSHTSVQAEASGEAYPSSVQTATNEIFAQDPTTTNRQYNADGSLQSESLAAEVIRLVTFNLVAIDSSQYAPLTNIDEGELDQVGKHGFRLQFASDDAEHANVFVDQNNKIQLVPEKFGSSYAAKVFTAGGIRLFPAGDQDWSLDYYSGILFFQDLDPAQAPATVEAYLYTGRFVSDVLEETGNNPIEIKGKMELLEVGGEPSVGLYDKLQDEIATFGGDTGVNGNLQVTGEIHTNKLIVQETTQVITTTNTQGNNVFGDPTGVSEDTHTFYGNVTIDGDLDVTGDGPNKLRTLLVNGNTEGVTSPTAGVLSYDLASTTEHHKTQLFLVDAGTSEISVILPFFSTPADSNGIQYIFKNMSTSGKVKLATPAIGGGTIDGINVSGGTNSIVLYSQYESITLVAYNNNWHIV